MASFSHYVKKLEYVDCQKNYHYREPKSRICLDPRCDKQQDRYKAICPICEQLNHKEHNTLPIKDFLNIFHDQVSKELRRNSKQQSFNIGKDPINALYYTRLIDESRLRFLKTINERKAQILDMFQEIQLSADLYFDRIGQMTLKLLNISKDLTETLIRQVQRQSSNDPKSDSKNNKQPKKFANLDSFLKSSLLSTNFNGLQDFSLAERLDYLIKDMQRNQFKLVSEFQLAIKSIKNNLKSTIEKLQLPIQIVLPLSGTFEWNCIDKSPFMAVTDKIIKQTTSQTSATGQRFAFMTPHLGKSDLNKIIVWAVKVKQVAGWLGIGICLMNKIKQKNYGFLYSSTGHGSYLISQNGYSWSDSEATDNSSHKVFHFTIGDTVHVCYDRREGKLKFIKNLGTATFSMKVIEPPENDVYCPCVNLCSNGDSVEIVDVQRSFNPSDY